jgi:hypothetical protein
VEFLSDDDGFGFVVGDISKYYITIWGIMSSGTDIPKKTFSILVSKVAFAIFVWITRSLEQNHWYSRYWHCPP